MVPESRGSFLDAEDSRVVDKSDRGICLLFSATREVGLSPGIVISLTTLTFSKFSLVLVGPAER